MHVRKEAHALAGEALSLAAEVRWIEDCPDVI